MNTTDANRYLEQPEELLKTSKVLQAKTFQLQSFQMITTLLEIE